MEGFYSPREKQDEYQIHDKILSSAINIHFTIEMMILIPFKNDIVICVE